MIVDKKATMYVNLCGNCVGGGVCFTFYNREKRLERMPRDHNKLEICNYVHF
jgi:hypothetical protein